MKSEESFYNSTCADQMPTAKRELSAFISAVTESVGPEEAMLSAEDWLEESKSMHSPPRSTIRDWRAVAASARLAKRLTVAHHHRIPDLIFYRFQGIANTIVQLLRFQASGVTAE